VDAEVTPLDVLLCAMRRHWAKREKGAAVALAKAAAPYVHARPKSGRVAAPIRLLGDGELDELCRIAERSRPVTGAGEV
jgi:hypothetical protein